MGINLYSVVGKMYVRMPIKRIANKINQAKCRVHGSFRAGRNRVDQIFVVGQLLKKYFEKVKTVCWAFMDLKKV